MSQFPAVQIRGLNKSYGNKRVLENLDLTVSAGTVISLLGPNGAGKTTVVEILQGLRRRGGGTVSVLGEDPGRASRLSGGRRRRLDVALTAELVPDVILMDLCMPGLDGVEATRRISAGSDAPRVVVLTTYDTDGDILRAYAKLGVDSRTAAVTEALRRGLLELD